MNFPLSIIIPVYKVEHTLDRCIESVLGQCELLEIILVDDNSPDSCPEKCDEWAGRKKNIVVIHKSNGGLSDARNAGLAVARGQYIAFIDSDDMLLPDTLSYALRFAIDNNCDMVEFPVCVDAQSPREHLLSFPEKTYDITSPEGLRHYWLDSKMHQHSYAWNKLYDRRLFDNVRYPAGRAYEDLWTLPELLLCAHRIGTVSTGAYVYVYNSEGICRSNKYEAMRMEALLRAYIMLGINKTDRNASVMLMDMLNSQICSYSVSGKINKEMAKLLRHLPISFGRNMSEKLKLLFLRIFGVQALCKAVKKIKVNNEK